MLALALALSSSVCWGVADFVGGLQARRLPLLRVMLVSQSVGLVGLVALLAVRGTGPPDLLRLVPAAVSGLAGIAALTAFYRALAIGTMSIVAPISATGVVVPVIAGVAGGERPAALQLAGIVAAIVGVVLASREQEQSHEARRASQSSIGLALIAAVGFGIFFVGLRSSARADVAWALLAARASGVAGLAAAVAISRPPPIGARRALAPLALMGILDLAANGLFAVATRHGLLSVVAVAASLYPLATVLLARAVLGERVQRIQELGIAVAVAGIALIATG